MTTLLASALVSHIVLGLVGLAGVHFAYMQTLRRTPPYKFIVPALYGAVVAFFASWATGAYYYVVHYGGAVKPRILASEYPWAHQFFMEAKEHVFIFIPFLCVVALLSILSIRQSGDEPLKRTVLWLLALILTIGTFSAASGILISGAVR